MEQFEGKVALITGAASGIGQALASALAAENARLVLCDVNRAAVEALAEQLRRQGSEAIAVAGDVADNGAVGIMKAAGDAAFGGVDLLCSNAGVTGRFAPTWEQRPEEWDWTFGVNVNGLANCLRWFVPDMIRSGRPGHVLVTASEASLSVRPYVGVYHASKHAVLAMAETLAIELSIAGADIGVTALCPGGVNTAIMLAEQRSAPAEGFAAALESNYRRSLPGAMAPEEAARLALEGVRQGRFYVFTHPPVKDRFAERAKAISEERYPAPDPGFIERLSAQSPG